MDAIDKYVTTSEAAAILGVTRHWVVALIRDKRLKAINKAAEGKPPVFLIEKKDLEPFRDLKPGNPNWIKKSRKPRRPKG